MTVVARVKLSMKKISVKFAMEKKLSRRRKLSKLRSTKVLLTKPSMFFMGKLMSIPAWNQVT